MFPQKCGFWLCTLFLWCIQFNMNYCISFFGGKYYTYDMVIDKDIPALIVVPIYITNLVSEL